MLRMTYEQVKALIDNSLTKKTDEDCDKKEEANTASALGQLLRPACKKGKECCGRCLEGKRDSACTPNRLERHVTPLREAVQIDPGKREIRAVVLTEGPGNAVDRNYYSKQSVEDLVNKINGIKCYINHQTEAEQKERGEGDIWSLAGYWRDAKLESVDDEGIQRIACVATMRCDKSVAGKEALAKATAAVQHRQEFPDSGEVYCGLSINKDGMQTGTVEANGDEYRGNGPAYANITAFAEKGSADLVTRPARGGEWTQLVESMKGGTNISKLEETEMKLKDVIAKQLSESLKRALEQKDDDTKTMKAKADLVDTAVTQAISKLDTGTAEMDAPPAPKAGEEMEPGATDPEKKEMDPGLAPEMLEMLKKDIMPMHEGESEGDYAGRVGDAMKLMGGGTQEADGLPPEKEKKGEESVKALESFRKDNQGKFDQLLADYQLKMGKESQVKRTTESENKELRSQLRESQAKLMIVSDLQEATKLLDDCDVQIPADMLCEADMVGMDSDQKVREVAKYKAILESARFGGGLPKTVTGGSGPGTLNLAGLRIVRKEKQA